MVKCFSIYKDFHQIPKHIESKGNNFMYKSIKIKSIAQNINYEIWLKFEWFHMYVEIKSSNINLLIVFSFLIMLLFINNVIKMF